MRFAEWCSTPTALLRRRWRFLWQKSSAPVPVESKPDGTFEFPAVAEGEWRFSAEAQRGSVRLRATEWIEVTRHDLENVKLRLVPPVTMRGKVVMEAPKDAPAPKPGPLILSLRGGRSRSVGIWG